MRLVLATRNRHKVEEIKAILGKGFHCLSLDDFPGAPPVVEDAPTFEGNATKKAVELARWLRGQKSDSMAGETFVLADDSGLEVDALNGAPGVLSARFAAADASNRANSPDTANNQKLLRLLKGVPEKKRTARFRCVLALAPILPSETAANSASPVCSADEIELQTELFTGVCEGKIALEPRGDRGFGYDPLFLPQGYGKSFAELGDEIKNKISHRSQALERLKARRSR